MIAAVSRRRETVELGLCITVRGERRWITTRARTYRDPSRGFLRATGYVIDDTHHRQVEHELLRQREKLAHLARVAVLGEISGSVAHQLNESVTSILCNVQTAQMLLARKELDARELQEISRDIVNDDERAGELIKQLRSLLVPRATKFERVEVAHLLRDVLTVVAGTVLQRSVQLTTRVARGIPAVYGDRVELLQVLISLVVNACDLMSDNAPDDRLVEIDAAHDTDERLVHVSVLDCGRGIDAERLDCILNPSARRSRGGLSLGLQICHSIVDAHK